MVSRAQHVNAGVNLAADGHDGLAPGYGVHHDGGRESAAVVAVAGKIQHVIVDNVLSDINRHSSMVVGPAAAGAGEGPGEAPDVEIPDLELPQAWRYSELKIQNPRGYFGGPGSANGAHLLDASALGAALGGAGAGGAPPSGSERGWPPPKGPLVVQSHSCPQHRETCIGTQGALK